MWWRNHPTNLEATLVWDKVVCAYCHQQYIRPEYADDPCPYCYGILRD